MTGPACPRVRAFTLVEILISIMILALGVLGLGVLFPVVIREQRLGVDASTGIVVANMARDILTTPQYSPALPALAFGNPPAFTPAEHAIVDGLVGACCLSGTQHTCIVVSFQSCTTQGGFPIAPGSACRPHMCEHPVIAYLGVDGATNWLWEMLRDREAYDFTPPAIIQGGLANGFGNGAAGFQTFGQGEWFTNLVVPAGTNVGTAKVGYPNVAALAPQAPAIKFQVFYYGLKPASWNIPVACVDIPLQQRLYPQHATVDPQFVWDYAVQRVSHFKFLNPPDSDDLRAIFFVRRVDSRIHLSGAATSVLDAITNPNLSAADRRLPLAEDANGNPTFDGFGGTGGPRYSGIHTCEVEFWFNPAIPAQNHPDRLYIPTNLVDNSVVARLPTLFAQMKQPGQKLVDNLGNIYTVIGSGNEPGITGPRSFDGVAGADYIRVDPPVPVSDPRRAAPLTQMTSYTGVSGNTDDIQRAVWQVCFTPQVPVAVKMVDLIRRAGQ